MRYVCGHHQCAKGAKRSPELQLGRALASGTACFSSVCDTVGTCVGGERAPEHEPITEVFDVLAAAALENPPVHSQLHAVTPLELAWARYLRAVFPRQVAVTGLENVRSA